LDKKLPLPFPPQKTTVNLRFVLIKCAFSCPGGVQFIYSRAAERENCTPAVSMLQGFLLQGEGREEKKKEK